MRTQACRASKREPVFVARGSREVDPDPAPTVVEGSCDAPLNPVAWGPARDPPGSTLSRVVA